MYLHKILIPATQLPAGFRNTLRAKSCQGAVVMLHLRGSLGSQGENPEQLWLPQVHPEHSLLQVPLLLNHFTAPQQLSLQKLPPAHSVTQHREGGGCLACSSGHFGMDFSAKSSTHPVRGVAVFGSCRRQAPLRVFTTPTPTELILAEAVATRGPQCKRQRGSRLSLASKWAVKSRQEKYRWY